MSPVVEGEVAIIRDLNDRFRQSFIGGQVVITAGVHARGAAFVLEVVGLVKSFTAFSKENDTQGAHDFGNMLVGSESVYWKIDYYDLALEGGSSDPADPSVTTRVLTILFAHEW